jgi:hypothetical protein
MNEIQIVRKILASHQQAYAQAHCVEKRDVIESDNIAIGYASVELANILAALGRNGALAGDGAAPLVGPQTNLEQNTLIVDLLNELAKQVMQLRQELNMASAHQNLNIIDMGNRILALNELFSVLEHRTLNSDAVISALGRIEAVAIEAASTAVVTRLENRVQQHFDALAKGQEAADLHHHNEMTALQRAEARLYDMMLSVEMDTCRHVSLKIDEAAASIRAIAGSAARPAEVTKRKRPR